MNLETLIAQHRELLIGAVARIVKCHETAEDLAHDAYLRVAIAAQQRPIRYLQPFLYQTARHLALDYRRKEQTRRRTYADAADEGAVGAVPSPLPGPEHMMAARQELLQLTQVLASLSKRRRDILLLHRLCGWRYADIAAHFGISVSAVEKHVRAAMVYCLAQIRADDEVRCDSAP